MDNPTARFFVAPQPNIGGASCQKAFAILTRAANARSSPWGVGSDEVFLSRKDRSMAY